MKRTRDRRRRLVLGTSLRDRIAEMARRDFRTFGHEVAWLVRLALEAPVEPPVEPRGDLAGDEPKSGIAYMAHVPEIDAALVRRVQRTQESISQAVRTLLRYGIAIADERRERWEKRRGEGQ